MTFQQAIEEIVVFEDQNVDDNPERMFEEEFMDYMQICRPDLIPTYWNEDVCLVQHQSRYHKAGARIYRAGKGNPEFVEKESPDYWQAIEGLTQLTKIEVCKEHEARKIFITARHRYINLEKRFS